MKSQDSGVRCHRPLTTTTLYGEWWHEFARLYYCSECFTYTIYQHSAIFETVRNYQLTINT